MPKAKANGNKSESFEATLWQTADKLRKNMDAAEYKHIVLGLIFLKYISDAFEVQHYKLVEGKGDFEGADPEDPNEYTAAKVFYVPPIARWKPISDNAKKTEILLDNGKKVDIGGYVDEAMEAIERQNLSLKGVLPKVYARQNLDRASLGGLIDLIGTIALGTEQAQSKDVLGRVYEYFLGQFALAEGKKGGQFYTPGSVVKLMVAMLEPYEGRVFDPCCGSGGMFVQSEKFIEAHRDHYKKNGNGNGFTLNPSDRISIYGQESNQTTWRLCKMNLAIRGIDSSNIKWNNEGSFLNDLHKDLKADFVLANPPFNDSDWSGELLKFEGDGENGDKKKYETAIRQIVNQAVESTEVVDIFDAAGIKKPEISLLSEEFLQDVKSMKNKNLSLELLKRILNDEIKVRLKFTLVEGKSLLDLLETSIKKYQNNLLTTAEIIEELLAIARQIRSVDGLAENLKLTKDEFAFYSALETNDSAVKVLGDETLKAIAREIADKVRKNATIDWTMKESARAKLMVIVKRTLNKYGYPPDKQQKAIDTVLKQAEVLADYWVEK